MAKPNESVLKKRLMVPVEAPLKQPWAAGYSGWLGVMTRELQFGSPVSRGSPPPARIAVTGRQNRYSYLPSQHAIRASELAVESIAKKRAASIPDRPWAIPRQARFHWSIG